MVKYILLGHFDRFDGLYYMEKKVYSFYFSQKKTSHCYTNFKWNKTVVWDIP